MLIGILPDDLARELAGLERFGFMLIFAILFFMPGFADVDIRRGPLSHAEGAELMPASPLLGDAPSVAAMF